MQSGFGPKEVPHGPLAGSLFSLWKGLKTSFSPFKLVWMYLDLLQFGLRHKDHPHLDSFGTFVQSVVLKMNFIEMQIGMSTGAFVRMVLVNREHPKFVLCFFPIRNFYKDLNSQHRHFSVTDEFK